ncbi:hypothetical protein Bbelb_098890 [Branchiostoma belcheri]|nr:hypothetical protein Bbelb_098890 [Branchiostoma belcheri]
MERPPNAGPQIPLLPDVFQAYVECNLLDKGYSVAVMEYYDGPRNRGSIRSEAHGSTRTVVYDFPQDEAFVITGPTCQTQKASELSMSQLGLFGVNSGNGTTTHIYSVNQVFHFGPQVSLFYEGTAEVRGVPVQWWSTCQYMADLDVTFFGQYYFTLPGYQSAAYSLDDARNPIPVRINVTGKTGSFPARHISHVYEFSQFRANIDAGVAAFETPPHVYCPGREETVPLPPVPQVFSFQSEVAVGSSRLIGNFKEWFDTENQLVRYDTKPPSSPDAPTSNPVSTVDDFNTGLSYKIDKRTGECTVSAVRNNSAAADDLPVDPFHVRMMTAEEFFHFENATWAYVGEAQNGTYRHRMGHTGTEWDIQAQNGTYRHRMGHTGTEWDIQAQNGTYRHRMGHTGTEWDIQAQNGTYRHRMGHTGTEWDIQAQNGTYRHRMGHTGTEWDIQAQNGTYRHGSGHNSSHPILFPVLQVDVGGLPCMKWIALREDFPPGSPIQTTWEWSFAQVSSADCG